jgi:LysR family hydrogen peroxide-inducible transcriptional activator
MQIINQAQKVLEASSEIKEIARQGHDPLTGPLKVGVIHTVGPYLLPYLMPAHMEQNPNMPLVLQESFTVRLVEMLRQGEIDCAIMAAPVPDSGLDFLSLYEEKFVLAVPADHRWAKLKSITTDELKDETMLLLGNGHCFRDQVLEACPEMSPFASSIDGIQRSFEGSSLETIRHMVASGLGITLLPESALIFGDYSKRQDKIKYIPIKAPTPSREIVLVWRKSYTRQAAIMALAESIETAYLPIFQKSQLA